jgi:hypothetical protein
MDRFRRQQSDGADTLAEFWKEQPPRGSLTGKPVAVKARVF